MTKRRIRGMTEKKRIKRNDWIKKKIEEWEKKENIIFQKMIPKYTNWIPNRVGNDRREKLEEWEKKEN